jgi:hypothetical protein
MAISGTKLRENIYQLLDQALETGEALEIKRKGRTLRIVPEPRPTRLAQLPRRPTINGDPEDLVHLDWSGEWKP